MFRRATSQFQPVTTGPVPPDYRVGPGDQLVLVIAAAVEQADTLTVSRLATALTALVDRGGPG